MVSRPIPVSRAKVVSHLGSLLCRGGYELLWMLIMPIQISMSDTRCSINHAVNGIVHSGWSWAQLLMPMLFNNYYRRKLYFDCRIVFLIVKLGLSLISPSLLSLSLSFISLSLSYLSLSLLCIGHTDVCCADAFLWAKSSSHEVCISHDNK